MKAVARTPLVLPPANVHVPAAVLWLRLPLRALVVVLAGWTGDVRRKIR